MHHDWDGHDPHLAVHSSSRSGEPIHFGGCVCRLPRLGRQKSKYDPLDSGKSLDYMVQRLMAFKSGKREGTVMNRIAKGYSDAEIAAIAKYLASK
ncbi:c-type cytochrome [Candidatus Entotheonella palauensis]|uniref:c-type cytochrome n=1 Tax=Candidatus Entotheonella palauensis TaxID=93172 RepID=UPI000B7E2BB4|nr:hypothetical protein [Candidatus Entotheonella palauensis]